ncbi:acyl-CoA thioesterase [Pseudooceanicola lipolyticus]|uniref:Acyl-CoA thioesterase n=1 Tax=Pseudooceanicola lipolyticus TaxID=2029104 RepID=A0A2M8ITG0_9RHOB|nr:acyl-CoA thioesterase [Pseudooceanicola lipolyticus]
MPDRAAEAPLSVVAFGTSLTASNPWPEALQAELASCLDAPVTVQRVAGSGQGSTWALAQWQQVAAQEPDVILLEFAINDGDLWDGISLRQSRAQHAELLTQLTGALPQARILLMVMNPVTGLQRLKRPRLGQYYAISHALAEEYDTGLADFAPRWQALPPGWAPDGLHPSAEAATAMLPPVLAPMIAAAAGQTCP